MPVGSLTAARGHSPCRTMRPSRSGVMWSLVNSAPLSLYNAGGQPQTAHPGSALRQTACRNAYAVCIANGSPRNTVYPATARE